MAWDRLRETALHYRGYSGFNIFDRLALVAIGVGGVLLVVGFLFFRSEGIGGLGAFLLILGALTLVRDFPGEGG